MDPFNKNIRRQREEKREEKSIFKVQHLSNK